MQFKFNHCDMGFFLLFYIIPYIFFQFRTEEVEVGKMNVTKEIVEKSQNSTLASLLTSVSPLAYNVIAAVEPEHNETNTTRWATGIPTLSSYYHIQSGKSIVP